MRQTFTVFASDYTERDLASFWSKVDRRAADECWPWMAAKSVGYGSFRRNQMSVGAHRISYALEHGSAPGGIMNVCHRCDNPACVNPAHLFLGTVGDNARDCSAKGRRPKPYGERSKSTSLEAWDVYCIRADRRHPKIVAADYRISVASYYDLKKRRSWRHLPEVQF